MDEVRERYIDIDNILLVNKEQTRGLIGVMFKTLTRCFRSKKIHVGMDKAYNLGRGRYLDRFGLKSKPDIMKDRLQDILEIAKRYDLRPIIWDDMFFSHYSSSEEGETVVPEGIDLMYWDYFNNTKEHYLKSIEQRIGGSIKRLRTTGNVIKSFTSGEIDKIEELEEIRLPLTTYTEEGMGEIVHCNQAQKIMTAGRMVW